MVLGSETHGVGCFVCSTCLHVSQRFVQGGWGSLSLRGVVAASIVVAGGGTVSFALLGARWTILRGVVVDIVRPIVTGCLCCILRLFLNTVTCKLERPAR